MSYWRRGAILCAAVVGVASLLVGAPTVSAHTDFESSSPAQGDVVAEPVSSVVLVFSADTQPIDDLVVVLDPAGSLRAPNELTTDDQRTFVATFDPPLAGGDIGVRWTVAGADGHPLEGSFSFTVTAPVPTTSTSTAPPSSTVRATDAATETATTEVDETEPVEDVADRPAADVAETASTPAPAATVAGESDPAPAGSRDERAQTLDDFLAVDGEVPGEGRRLAGRLLSIPTTAAVIGSITFLAWAFRGSSREIASIVSGVRIAGVAIAVGAVAQYLGAIASTGSSFVDGVTEAPGGAAALRFAGAALVVIGLRTRMVPRHSATSLSAAVIDHSADTSTSPASTGHPGRRERWDAARSKVALAGVVPLVASFWFDGHTGTRGWFPLHALVDSVHVVAGSVWFGGVITLAVLAWWRFRRGDDVRLDELVVRFSSIATVALVAVAVAGLTLSVIVLDSFGELTSTQWGRTLLLKTGAVAIAACLGAYNHVRLRPALVASPDDSTVRATLRSVLTAEAIILTFVAVVTCWLVAAAV